MNTGSSPNVSVAFHYRESGTVKLSAEFVILIQGILELSAGEENQDVIIESYDNIPYEGEGGRKAIQDQQQGTGNIVFVSSAAFGDDNCNVLIIDSQKLKSLIEKTNEEARESIRIRESLTESL